MACTTNFSFFLMFHGCIFTLLSTSLCSLMFSKISSCVTSAATLSSTVMAVLKQGVSECLRDWNDAIYSPELVVNTEDLLLPFSEPGRTSGLKEEPAPLLFLLLDLLVEVLLCMMAFTLAE